MSTSIYFERTHGTRSACGQVARCVSMRALFLGCWLSVAACSAAAVCRVESVHDGDTLTVSCAARVERVRLMEIDAPELRQPYGGRSAQSLRTLCLGAVAELDRGGVDRYGRTLARVRCDGIDASAHQVRRGAAWAFTRYLTDPHISALESEARAARRGLWSRPDPVPPWIFRRGVAG